MRADAVEQQQRGDLGGARIVREPAVGRDRFGVDEQHPVGALLQDEAALIGGAAQQLTAGG